MVSTKEERTSKAVNFLTALLGPWWKRWTYVTTKPLTLPKGINYTRKEWCLLHYIMFLVIHKRDVSISYLFLLEEMENKYKNNLMLAKLQS